MAEIFESFDDYLKYIMLGFNFTILIIVYLHSKGNQPAKKHHVLFVTSQPDDQSLYFLPTIKSIVDQYFVHILCLSGKGQPKQKKLQLAVKKLRVDHCKCLSNDQLRQKQQRQLSESIVRQKILSYVKENNIKAIFTFDNQCAFNKQSYKTILKSLKKLQIPQKEAKVNKKQQNPEESQSIKLYFLQSVSSLRKYSFILQIFFALYKDYAYFNFNLPKVWDMLSIHKNELSFSQKLYATLGRYSYINTYKKILISTSSENKLL